MVSQVRVLFEAPKRTNRPSAVRSFFCFGYVPKLRYRGCAKPWARAAQHALLTVAGKTVRWTVLPLRCNHASGRRRSPYSSQVRVLFEAPCWGNETPTTLKPLEKSRGFIFSMDSYIALIQAMYIYSDTIDKLVLQLLKMWSISSDHSNNNDLQTM